MSKDKFFLNNLPDYTPENAALLITNKKINPTSKISVQLPDKWKDTLSKYKHLDFNDTLVYTGTSGIALLRLKQNPDDTENLNEVLQLLGLRKLKQKRCTFLCGDAGPLAIGAVINFKLRNESELQNNLKRILSFKDEVVNIKSDIPNELMYGRSGYLYALLYVNTHITPPPIDDSLISQVINAIIISGKREANIGKFDCPLMYQWHESHYLGAAHGLSGILYLLLQAKKYLNETELTTLIKPTIDYLITLKFKSDNFPSSLGRDNDRYVQWCHGAPGFVYLFTTAYKVFQDPKYLQLALKCGDVIWKRGLLRKGYSICHGVSGNAYCFLELYQTTKDEKHLYRAIKFAEWCLDYSPEHEEYPPDRPLSLFEGISGPMYLLLDIQNPLEAKFPGFTL